MTRDLLYLVDGTSQLFRAYFAISGLTNPEGLPTNAVYGFTTMLRKLLKEEGPRFIAVAFDPPGPVFRVSRYAEYKANRKPMPEELVAQIPVIDRLLEAWKVPTVSREGFEADDVIGTLARMAEKDGMETFIVSRDKDLKQLLSDRVKLFDH